MLANGTHWLFEEHRSESADGDVKRLVGKSTRRGIGKLKRHVAESFCPGEVTGLLDHVRRDVDSMCASCGRHSGCLTGGLAGSTSNVQHPVFRTYVICLPQPLVVALQLRVVVDDLSRPSRNSLRTRRFGFV
jgi:hypothetical protein